MSLVKLTDRDSHNLAIHALTKEDMKVAISKLENFYDVSFGNIKFKPGLRVKKFHQKDKNTDYIPNYVPNPELAKSINFHMLIPKHDIELIFDLLDVPKKCNKWLWYPRPPHQKYYKHKVVCDIKVKYPIYILSKGRWEHPYTAQYLMDSNIDFKMVVEPQEYDEYIKKIPKDKLIKLPKKYLGHNRGGIPARNFIYHYSKEQGEHAHWCLDDNITTYYYSHNSYRMKMNSGLVFRQLEDFMDRYENLYLVGHHYKMFAIPLANHPLVIYNTRLYSSMLIRNDIPVIENGDLWLGKYNEDTDLSLRLLLKKLPSVIFMNITADKLPTGTCKGGNTDSIYKEDENGSGYLKTKAICDKYPNLSKMVDRFGRKHHFIDYTKHFSGNQLTMKGDLECPDYHIKFEPPA